MDFDCVGSYVIADLNSGYARLAVQVGRKAVFGVSIKNGGSPRTFSHFSTPGVDDMRRQSEIWSYVYSPVKSATCLELDDFEKLVCDDSQVWRGVVYNLLQCNTKMMKSWSKCHDIGNRCPIQDNHFTNDEMMAVNSELDRIDKVIMRIYDEINSLGGGSAAKANAAPVEEEWKDVDINGMDNDVLDSIVGHGSTGEFEMHGRQWRFIENGGELVLQSRSCGASSRGGEGDAFSESRTDGEANLCHIRLYKTMALVLDNGGTARFEKGRLYECSYSNDKHFNGAVYIGLLDANGIEGYVKNDRVKLVQVYVEPPMEAAKTV